MVTLHITNIQTSMDSTKNGLSSTLPNKYIIAIIGDANAGKTTTIAKIYENLYSAGKISGITYLWNKPDINNPTIDFSLIGNTIYGITGILSRGDVICTLKSDLEVLAIAKSNVIVCACRKQYPDTFNAVAGISWMYGYNIIWVDLSCPTGTSKDLYTDGISARISSYF